MKVAIYTLGCKVNQYETQAMEQELRRRGHEVVEFSAEADAYVVNSCSVTAVSDQKARQMLHRVRRKHPEAVAAICGCYPQTHAADMEALDVDLISGTGDRLGFLTLLEEAVAEIFPAPPPTGQLLTNPRQAEAVERAVAEVAERIHR